MKPETQRYLELLQKRLAGLQLLASELGECRNSFICMDLEAMRLHIARQESLCAETRALDGEIETARRQLAAGAGLEAGEAVKDEALQERLGADSAGKLRLLRDELARARNSLRRLNRVHAGMLKGSGRTVSILLNTISSCAGIYGPPGRNVWRRR